MASLQFVDRVSVPPEVTKPTGSFGARFRVVVSFRVVYLACDKSSRQVSVDFSTWRAPNNINSGEDTHDLVGDWFQAAIPQLHGRVLPGRLWLCNIFIVALQWSDYGSAVLPLWSCSQRADGLPAAQRGSSKRDPPGPAAGSGS